MSNNACLEPRLVSYHSEHLRPFLASLRFKRVECSQSSGPPHAVLVPFPRVVLLSSVPPSISLLFSCTSTSALLSLCGPRLPSSHHTIGLRTNCPMTHVAVAMNCHMRTPSHSILKTLKNLKNSLTWYRSFCAEIRYFFLPSSSSRVISVNTVTRFTGELWKGMYGMRKSWWSET
jgi:hypothetical protein